MPYPHHIAEEIASLAAELLWPTRCAVCDEPGWLICPACLAQLSYIDSCRACPRCGAPFGAVQCSECATTLLEPMGFDEPPFESAVAALTLDERAHRIVTTYKDRGERRLAGPMAQIIARYLPPSWLAGPSRTRPGEPLTVTAVPATVRARAKRGFDHGELLARQVAELIERPYRELFLRPHTRDQRTLGREARHLNMMQSVVVNPSVAVPPTVLVIDDVCTTGSTLFAASQALHAAHCTTVRCATFARV